MLFGIKLQWKMKSQPIQKDTLVAFQQQKTKSILLKKRKENKKGKKRKVKKNPSP